MSRPPNPSTDRRAPSRPVPSGVTAPRPGAANAADAGSAALEFILVGVILLVPLVYLIVALGLIQEQALGVQTGARQIVRAVSTAPDAQAAHDRVRAVTAGLLPDYGIDVSTVRVTLTCTPAGGGCPRADGVVTVTVTARVSLPLAPPVFSLDRRAAVPVQATAGQRMSRLWGSAP